MASATVRELVDQLRVHLADDGEAILDRLLKELDVHMWPTAVFEAARDIFGPAVFADTSRTRLLLDRRIRHALAQWDKRHGPLNLAQEAYASSVLCAAMRSGAEGAAGDRAKLFPFVLTKLDLAVNHEVVHQGFKRRRGGHDRSQEIAEMVG